IIAVVILLLLRNRAKVKMVLERRLGERWRSVVAAILVVSSLVLALAFHNVSYAGNLYWGIEEGDQFSYSVESSSGYYEGLIDYSLLELNNSVLIFTIESLPEIPFYCNGRTFCELLVNHAKASVTYENGSSINPDIEQTVNALFSNTLLPVGDWAYLDRLFYDSPRGGYGSSVQDPWFSRIEPGFFHFGRIVITCIGAPGWEADISLEDGVPNSIQKHPPDWGGETTILTRIFE
ncbi:MAG: hypothetical protein ACFFD9_01425, partial [Candidatus Thorarchaeota archaeon]